MRLKWNAIVSLALVFGLLFGSSVFAFEDINGDPAERSILALKEAGVVSGIDERNFAPQGKITYAQGVHLIVKAFKLNMDSIRFVKEPKASDYYANVPDDAWYSSSFIIAHHNGLPLSENVDPARQMTREEFAHLLMKAVLTTGDYAFIELYVIMTDEKEVDPQYMDSIQKLLITKIAMLDNNKQFHPKRVITRAEAANWVHAALEFVKEHRSGSGKPGTDQPPSQDMEVTMNIEKITEEVIKVVLSWGSKPNSGYRIAITGIEFNDNGEAVIHYDLQYPKPGHAYLQVITEPKAETFVASKYKPVIRREAQSTQSSPGTGVPAN